MKLVKIELDINQCSQAEKDAAMFLLFGVTQTLKVVDADQVAASAAVAKKAIDAAATNEITDTVVQSKNQGDQSPKNEGAATEVKLTLVDLRAVMAPLRDEHSVALRAELTRLGAANLRVLPVEKYPEFMAFMESLKK